MLNPREKTLLLQAYAHYTETGDSAYRCVGCNGNDLYALMSAAETLEHEGFAVPLAENLRSGDDRFGKGPSVSFRLTSAGISAAQALKK